MQILYTLSQEATLQIISKCDLNSVSAKEAESVGWYKRSLLYIILPVFPWFLLGF